MYTIRGLLWCPKKRHAIREIHSEIIQTSEFVYCTELSARTGHVVFTVRARTWLEFTDSVDLDMRIEPCSVGLGSGWNSCSGFRCRPWREDKTAGYGSWQLANRFRTRSHGDDVEESLTRPLSLTLALKRVRRGRVQWLDVLFRVRSLVWRAKIYTIRKQVFTYPVVEDINCTWNKNPIDSFWFRQYYSEYTGLGMKNHFFFIYHTF